MQVWVLLQLDYAQEMLCWPAKTQTQAQVAVSAHGVFSTHMHRFARQLHEAAKAVLKAVDADNEGHSLTKLNLHALTHKLWHTNR